MEVLFTTEEHFALTIHWPNEDLFSDKVTDSNIRFLKLKGFVQKGRISNFGRFSFLAGSS